MRGFLFFLNRLQQAQLLRRRMAVMNTRTTAPSVQSMSTPGVPAIQGGPMASGSGGMSPSSVASPVSSMGGMVSPHQPGIGLKPGTQTPPANVLQVVKQVINCVILSPHFHFIYTNYYV